MPIPGDRLEAEVIFGTEMPSHHTEQYNGQHNGTQGHMQPVKTGKHEEGGTVNATFDGEAGLGVLMGLQPQKGYAQQNGKCQANLELGAVVFNQPPMCPSDGSTRAQQD